MPISCEVEDGPAVLQLCKWRRLRLHLELSKFREAFISPTRQRLVLLSDHSEAVLLSLFAGDSVTSISDVSSGRFSLQGEEPFPTPAQCPGQVPTGAVEKLENIMCKVTPPEVKSHTAFSDSGDPAVFECCPTISGVKSLAWGHCREASSQLEDSIFNELLVVSGDGGIIMHAFCHSNSHRKINNSTPDVGKLHGEWTEWCPTQSITSQDGQFRDDISCRSSPKKWFQTFLTEANACISNGKYQVRFPTKSSFPPSAEVLSFSIHDTTLSFLEFCSDNCSQNSKRERESSDPAECSPGYVPASETSCNSQFECLRVFSSSSCHLVGLVLTSGNQSIDSSEVHQSNTSKVFVVVTELFQWGMQWNFLADLHNVYPGLAPSPEWADFQLSDRYLFCLNSAGLVGMWDVNSGSLVTRFDVLQSYKADLGMHLGRTGTLVANLDVENGQTNIIHRSENCTQDLVGRRTFKKLLVASHTLLLAIIDEHGVIYVFYGDDIINCKHIMPGNSRPPFLHYDGDNFAAWEAAGHEIGGLIFCARPPVNLGLCNAAKSGCDFSESDDIGPVRPWKRRRKQPRYKENQVDSWPSGFSTAAQLKGGGISCVDTVKAFNPLRRIILPLYRLQEEDTISLSPFGITRIVKDGTKGVKIVHTNLLIPSSFLDERDMGTRWLGQGCPFLKESTFIGISISCSFQGRLYLITEEGLSVVLPSISTLSDVSCGETVKYWQPDFAGGNEYYAQNLVAVKESAIRWKPWQIEVLDRALLYEGPVEADWLCWENGWDLKVSRLRRMQLALQYLKIDDLEQSLNMLVDVNLAEEGVLQLLLASVYRIFCRTGSDNEVALSSRLMALAVRFATKMIKYYGQLKQKKDVRDNSRRLCEMAYLLEVIRGLQNRVSAKSKKSAHMADGKNATTISTELLQNESSLPIVVVDGVSSGSLGGLDAHDKQESASAVAELAFDGNVQLALTPVESSLGAVKFHDLDADEEGTAQIGKQITLENIKDMMTRWEMCNFDLKTVVKEALLSGRLPLAVLQLQILRQRELVSDEESRDAFYEVQEIGRSIVYDLFLEGETGRAVATLERLGDDIETALRQLMLGTVRRSLRLQIAEEMKKRGFLRSNEWNILENISLIERFYPISSFWDTYLRRKNIIHEDASVVTLPGGDESALALHFHNQPLIESGDIDGAVIGSWANVNNRPDLKEFCGNDSSDCYWACAAVWSDAWDQSIVDRIVLDQPYHAGIEVPWESQFEYQIAHNHLFEVFKLMDTIPATVLSEGILRVNMDNSQPAADNISDVMFPDYTMYICAADELEPLCLEVPHVKVFRSSSIGESTSWLRMLMEQELAKKHIFLKEYWQNTSEIIPLLARASIIINTFEIAPVNESFKSSVDIEKSEVRCHKDSEEAFHKLVVHYCVQYNLPYLLDLYLDHRNLVQDKDTLLSLKEAAGDCQWAKWLLFARVKGCEYEASFSNARWNLLCKMIHHGNLSVMKIDEVLYTVDDMAERRGEMAALATLMYAAIPIQKSLCTGSVNRNRGSSSQCTLENLRPILQQFPTLCRALLSSCFGQDAYGCLNYNPNNVFGKSPISEYLRWRYNIFSSSRGDTSLLQMLPCWFPKSIRRLVQLFEQGPFGMQLLSDAASSGEFFAQSVSDYIFNTTGYSEVNALSLEASIQKSIEEELYSSLEEKDFRVEHHLHRGRALAAFCHLLGKRTSQLKSANARQELSSGQPSVQADVQLILAPLSQTERSILLSVAPLAITNFEDSTLVASCVFLLELCGLSSNTLRLDIAALQRISSYYRLAEQNMQCELASPRSSALHALSHGANVSLTLARALAEDYVQFDYIHILEQKQSSSKGSNGKQTSQSLIAILYHLEKASLPPLDEGKTCGFWLLSGIGDAPLWRAQQNEASQHWKLVTEFCQTHHLPLSTKYLALLANDNDWVGFLTEAQLGSFPIDIVIQVAAKEIRDSRLKTHVLTVLKSILATRRKVNSSTNTSPPGNTDPTAVGDGDNDPMELFGILAECEKQKNPGETLLNKAKEMRWSLLALIASCFPDVTPLSCLSVWLEITAARETSLIKVDDISSKIAKNVGSAVQATNQLPSTTRNVEYRYNRRNPKRRRFLEATSESFTLGSLLDVTYGQDAAVASITTETIMKEERGKTISEEPKISVDIDERLVSLSNMVAVLCEQHLFLPLLRAFEMFLPSSSLLPFIRSLQAFSQMRLPEASAHLASFSARIKDEASPAQLNSPKAGTVKTAWVVATAVKAADAVLSTCPSVYEKRCLLQLLAAVDFADGGSSSSYFCRLYWKINLAEPSLCKDGDLYLWNGTMDDASLLTALEKNGRWEQARNWARQLESSDVSWKSAVHHVTESQAEAMVAEWKEFLWDIPQERAALWGYCQALFVRYSFPPLQAGLFFLKHAEAIEKEIPTRELHEILLLCLQWLSGTITQSPPVYPLHLLREIETRVWLLAVESEGQSKTEGDFAASTPIQNLATGNSSSIIEHTASIITKMDNHINAARMKATERNGSRDNSLSHQRHLQLFESSSQIPTVNNTRTKRRAKVQLSFRQSLTDNLDSINDSYDYPNSPHDSRISGQQARNLLSEEEFAKMEASLSGWEQNVRPVDMERAVLSLLEFGQITAAKQLQHKLSPSFMPQELVLIDVALKVASLSSNSSSGEISLSCFDSEVPTIIQSFGITRNNMIDPSQALESLAMKCGEGCGRALCRRIIAVVKAGKLLGLSFSEAFEKQPVELLQLLSLKAQDSFEEAKLLVETHIMPASSIARILAESFLKGLLAAHRGGYLDSQKEEGPAPLLWRSCDFLKWSKLCPSESEIGHALMRLVMTGQEVPHACEVELLILSHHFYMSSACLDGVDVLVTFAANRVESYVLEGDFSCLARLITGVSNFHSLNFILDILIENGQLELLLQKYSTTDAATGTSASVRGFRMAVLTSLNHFNPNDDDAFSMVYKHFDMKHEAASLLESRSTQYMKDWLSRRGKDRQNDELLEAMHHLIETAEVLSTIDAGQRTHRACARASLLSLQIRIPDLQWIELSETNARRVLVDQSRFQEALIVAEAYNLNQPTEWAPVFWNQMLKPDLIEQFVAEFVLVLPLQPSMLLEVARFYRSEVAARGDQSHFSVWLSPGGLPAEWVKHLGRSFRSLLKRTRDIRVRIQVATLATGFADVIDACNRVLDKVPEGAGPLILRRGHGGAYLPLM